MEKKADGLGLTINESNLILVVLLFGISISYNTDFECRKKCDCFNM